MRRLAEAVVSSSDPPAGFVRRALPVGEEEVDVYAEVADDGAGAGPTVVVVLTSPRHALPDEPQLRRRFGLTPREAEVALLLAARRSNKEIARELSISANTAWRHTERVLAKLNTDSRRDVARVLRSATRTAAPRATRAAPRRRAAAPSLAVA